MTVRSKMYRWEITSGPLLCMTIKSSLHYIMKFNFKVKGNASKSGEVLSQNPKAKLRKA